MTAFADFRSAAVTVAPRAAVVFGSGLAGAAESHFIPTATIPYADVPGLVPPTVAGHGGKLAVGHWAGVPAVVCFGRVHFYEGHSWDRVTALVRLIAEFGVKTLVLTNAAGGIRDDLNPGDLMPIGGHLKLLGPEGWKGMAERSPPTRLASPSALLGDLPSAEPAQPAGQARHLGRGGGVGWLAPLPMPIDQLPNTSPLVGEVGAVSASSPAGWGGTHPSWSFIPQLESATACSAGIYAALTGPCYETPAEIRALRAIGADAVGMSTAIEAETAASLGLTVAGVSCITNKAAGLSAGTLSHHEVEVVAKLAVGKLGAVLSAVLTGV